MQILHEPRVRYYNTARTSGFYRHAGSRKANIGQVFATPQCRGRRQTLAYDWVRNTVRQPVCGIFSATQVSGQLGVQFEPVEMAATTVAEMKAALHAS